MNLRGNSKSLLRGVGRRLPLLLLVASVILLAFFAGMVTRALRVPWIDTLYPMVAMNLTRFRDFDVSSRRATRRAKRLPPDCRPWSDVAQNAVVSRYRTMHILCPSKSSPADAVAARIEFIVGDGLSDPVLVKGEVGTFLDRCPGPWGCLAVEYSRSGVVSRSWNFDPEAIAAANIAPAWRFPYKHPLGWSFAQEVRGFAISPYPDGDLLVVFRLSNSLPAGGGVARVSPDGRPRWYRKDYSDGWPFVIDQDTALVSAMRLHPSSSWTSPMRRASSWTSGHQCDGIYGEEVLRLIDGDGEVLEEIVISRILGNSPFSSYQTKVRCHPSHVNFAHVISEDASFNGIARGDMVISLQNLNAFGILDKNDRRLKKLVHGSFHRQHGVRHLEGTKFLMFDSLGTDGVHGPSRLLMLDLATSEETTVFPNDAAPAYLRDWFAAAGGQFDISADRRRALVVDPEGARAFEVRLSDGRALSVFRQIHDLSSLEGMPAELINNAALFRFNGIHYANRWQGA